MDEMFHLAGLFLMWWSPGTGGMGFPLVPASKIAMEITRDFLAGQSADKRGEGGAGGPCSVAKLELVRFVCFTEAEFDAFAAAKENAIKSIVGSSISIVGV